MKKLAISLLLLAALGGKVRADEGMWLPIFAEKYNLKAMQAKGFKLSAQDIYNENQNSLKEAVVIFGRGCTGEIISKNGLVITNHHCGFDNIQKHSSVEHDYLKDGFWAYTAEQELPNPGLSVKILVRMKDVTSEALQGVNGQMSESERQNIIRKNSKAIVAEAKKGNGYLASVEAMFYGNQYILFVYEEYKDVRLVGAPPSAIGKFGGDTDNWMWPRHTGDFSMFRIYADKNNHPADYSPNNVPYTPKRSLKVSLKGIKENDFTLVYGYPGRTQEYLPASSVQLITEVSNPNKIRLRTKRLDIQNAEMVKDPAVRIKYAAKNAYIANAWKKWQGELKGLIRLRAVEKKKEFEATFTTWAKNIGNADYASVIEKLDANNEASNQLTVAKDFQAEALYAIEAVRFASSFDSLVVYSKAKNADAAKISKQIDKLKDIAEPYFKDYFMPIDQKTFVAMMEEFDANVPSQFMPAQVQSLKAKYKGFAAMAAKVYAKSVFTDKARFDAFVNGYTANQYKKVEADPLYMLVMSVRDMYKDAVDVPLAQLRNEQDLLLRTYMKGQMEYQPNKVFYPDANSTLRISYGKVEGYKPVDAVKYEYQSTIEGIMQKDNPNIYDYDVPTKLHELYAKKDYGRYAVNGTIPVAFTASNHTTGGNSGSPVLDGDGNLIGVNFDRCWEGTMSDIMYDPDQCRNIILDIRYAMFLIDKYAGAKRLVDEIDVVE
ncbi:S46 family peptidase [uncultured Acetobacteroides sp.]|uniref:S46 family peptidase n=1 Tax=uncultured Acetobacteroides sp. TaxID=1760811 RepID=UPI0029F541C2|nr:S46 family peptidase [uncultured Acetobacteroides sp.]